jgi:tripartite-type tricarboxylate transporter receptor subunit TctC
MPKEVIALLNKEMNRAVMLPDVRERLDTFGLEVHTESPEFFADVIRRDFEKWGKVAREIGLNNKL